MEFDKLICSMGRYIEKSKKNNDYNNMLNKLNLILLNGDLSKISDLKLDELSFIFGSEVSSKIKSYQKLFGLKYFEMTEHQKLHLTLLINNLIVELKNQMQVTDKVKMVMKLKYKLEHIDTEYLSGNEIDLICEFLDEIYDSVTDRIEILVSLVDKSFKILLQSSEEPNNNEDEIQNVISEDEAIELFKQYGYDFNTLKKTDKTYIVKFGNLEKMKKIFEVLKNKNIRINFAEYGSKFSRIIASSTEEIVSEIINNIIVDGDEDNFQKNFNNYLNFPSIFIGLKKTYKKNGVGGNFFETDRHTAAYENYVSNRNVFLKLGLNINEIIENCGTVLELSHDKLLKNLSCLQFYGISLEEIKKCLSCLCAGDMGLVIDRFVELGFYDYLKSHLSITLISENSPVFYKLKKAKLDGCDDKEIFYGNSDRFKGKIRNDDEVAFGVDGNNGKTIVEEYDFSSDFDFAFFDEISEPIYQLYFVNKSNMIKILENSDYKVNNFNYNFDGVIISRLKVFKYYEMLLKCNYPDDLNSIKYVIVKNSILTFDEYKKIETCIDGLFNSYIRR